MDFWVREKFFWVRETIFGGREKFSVGTEMNFLGRILIFLTTEGFSRLMKRNSRKGKVFPPPENMKPTAGRSKPADQRPFDDEKQQFHDRELRCVGNRLQR